MVVGQSQSENFESIRRRRYTVSTTDSEGSIVMTIVKRKVPEEEDVFEPAQLSKRRRLMEEDGLETGESSFFFSTPPKRGAGRRGQGAGRRAAWICHACQLATPGQRVRCGCKKMIHKVCRTYGLCAPA